MLEISLMRLSIHLLYDFVIAYPKILRQCLISEKVDRRPTFPKEFLPRY